MSKYTMTIQEYINSCILQTVMSTVQYKDYEIPTILEEYVNKQSIHEYGRKLFPQNFPIYDESKREEFMDAFIDHFYFYEIGQETIAQFKWYLEDFLNTRMPYYQQLYESKLSSLDEAIQNYDIQKEETNAGTANTTTSGKTTGKNTANTQTVSEESATSKNLQFPLNSAEIQEISRVNNDGNSSDNTATDENTEVTSAGDSATETNNHITGRTYGILGVNKIARTKAFRDLIYSINELIFKDARDNNLFMKLW